MAVGGSVSSVLKSLEAIAQGTKFLQELPESQKRFEELRKEITFIEDLTKGAQTLSNDPFSNTQQVATAILRLNEISDDLHTIEQDVARSSDGDFAKVRKAKWVLKSNKIDGLLQKAQEAKSNLSHAVLLQERQQNKLMAIQVSQLYNLLVSPEQTNTNTARPLCGSRPVDSLRTTAPVSISTREYDTNKIEEVEEEEEDVEDIPIGEIHRLDTISGSKGVPSARTMTQHDLEVYKSSIRYKGQECPANCNCRCHSKPWYFKNSNWFQPIFGSLTVSYLSGYEKQHLKWDYRCACNKEGSLKMIYQPPKWLQKKLLFSQASYPLRCALRPVRRFPIDHRVWHDISLPVEELKRLFSSGQFYFPDDECSMNNVVEALIGGNSYDALEFLLAVWASILQTTSLRSNTWYSVNIARVTSRTERESHVLRQVESYIEYKPEPKYNALDLLRTTDNMEEIINDSHLINEWDYLGDAPIHHAVIFGEIEVLERLLDAGADVNRNNKNGLTPLMDAATRGRTDCMRILLKRSCNLNAQDRVGNTALQYAVNECNVNCVRLLLREGASASISNFWEDTVLHTFGKLEITECNSNAKEILDLLINAKDIDFGARNNRGYTPLAVVLYKSNEPLLRLFCQAGVSVNFYTGYSENLLHLAAQYCHLDCLLFLDELGISGVQTEIGTTENYTPWDLFLYYIFAPEESIGDGRHPSSAEISAFVKLYQGIRDRNLQYEALLLTQAFDALSANEDFVACDHLSTLQAWKMEYHCGNTAAWYRALSNQIKYGTRDEAVAQIEECLEELSSEIGSSPWKQFNIHGFEFDDERVRDLMGDGADQVYEIEHSDTSSERASSDDGDDAEQFGKAHSPGGRSFSSSNAES